MINKSTHFTVKNVRYVHHTTKKIINSFYSEIIDNTYTTHLQFAMRKEGEEIIRYIDREGNVFRI